MSLNVDNWRFFFLKDICNIFMGNKLDYTNMSFDHPSINFIGRSADNNGLAGIVDRIDDVEPYRKGCVTVALGGSLGSAYIQNADFYTSQNVSVLEFDSIVSCEAKLFVTSMIMNECKYKYFPFGRELNTHIRKDFGFNLPQAENGDPDWDFMEQYIKSLHYKKITTSNRSCQLKNFDLDVNHWKEFSLSAIFTEIETGKAHDNMLDDGDDCIYLGAKKDDNCIMRHCASNPALMHRGNCIAFICNGQGSVGYTNYIDRPFIATTDLKIGYSDKLNKYNALFFVTILDKERQKYSFGRKWGPHLKNTTFKLPARMLEDGSYEPDWTFMENYVKSLPYGDRI